MSSSKIYIRVCVNRNTDKIPNKTTDLYYYHNTPIKKDLICDSVSYLYLWDDFNSPLENLPEGIKSINFGDSFNQVVNESNIPKSVRELTFNGEYNKYNVLPFNVKTLYFYDDFDYNIPEHVENLYLYGDKYNQDIKLPSNLNHLTIKSGQNIKNDYIPRNVKSLELLGYNKPLTKSLIPNSITKLKFMFFNQKLKKGDIPNTVEKLDFGLRFNQELELNDIPDSVIELRLSINYNIRLLTGSLPNKLKKLYFGEYFNQELFIDNIPETVTHLYFGNRFNKVINIGVLPQGLTHLEFGKRFNNILSIENLPYGLKHLKLGEEYNKLIESIPDTIEYLFLGGYKKSIKFIPFGVKELVFDKYNMELCVGDIPCSVTHLTFGADYNHPIYKDVLPNSIIYLKFGDGFDRLLFNGSIPNSVKKLVFGRKYNQPIKKNIIPNSVIQLKLGENYDQELFPICIPSIKELICYNIPESFDNDDVLIGVIHYDSDNVKYIKYHTIGLNIYEKEKDNIDRLLF